MAGMTTFFLSSRPSVAERRASRDPVTPVVMMRTDRGYWFPAGACHRAALRADPLAGKADEDASALDGYEKRAAFPPPFSP
jgi:hypothetical protein